MASADAVAKEDDRGDGDDDDGPELKVDICAAIMAEKPPLLPLREELNSLGFEVVLAPSGTGVHAARYQSKKAVERYRLQTAFRDLKKRRVFPKSNRRIQEKLEARKRIEHELELPHALSYETYEIKLHRTNSSSSDSATHYSSNSMSDSQKKRAWGMFKRRQKQKIKTSTGSNNTNSKNKPSESSESNINSEFQRVTSTAMFPDLRAQGGSFPSPVSNATINERESWRKAFGGWMAETFEAGQEQQSPNRIVDGVPEVFGAFDGIEQVQSNTTNGTDIFDGIDSAGLLGSKSNESCSAIANSSSNAPSRHSSSAAVMNISSSTAPTRNSNQNDTFSVRSSPDPPVQQKSTKKKEPVSRLYLAPQPKQDPDGVSLAFSSIPGEEASRTSIPSQIETVASPETGTSDYRHEVSTKIEEEKKEQDGDADADDDDDARDDAYRDSNNIRKGEDCTAPPSRGPSFDAALAISGSGDDAEYWDSQFSDSNRIETFSLDMTSKDGSLASKSVLAIMLSKTTKGCHRKDQLDSVAESPSKASTPKKGDALSNSKLSTPKSDFKADSLAKTTISTNAQGSQSRESFGAVSATGQMLLSETKSKESDASNHSEKQSGEKTSGLSPRSSKLKSKRHQKSQRIQSPGLHQTKPSLSTASTVDVELANSVSPFDQATSETCQAVGINAQGAKKEPEKPTPKQTISPMGWMSSAKNVLDTLSNEVIKVAGFDKGERKNQPATQSPKSSKSPKSEATGPMPLSAGSSSSKLTKTSVDTGVHDIKSLRLMLSRFETTTSELETILATNPELPQEVYEEDGRVALHMLCDRGMPDRSQVPVERVTAFLLGDIASYKNHIKLVFGFNPGACLVLDTRGDLPLHLLSRRFMEWEATWYEIVYREAAKENSSREPTAIAITKLYQAMTETIEMILKPVIDSSNQCEALCRAPGSMGTILPLHIAAIFTVSVNSLRRVLEANPEAAGTNCDLGILRTFVPDECLPLELHDNLSTDFPKWENNENDKGETSPRENNGANAKSSEDSIRRSDLLFAYHPIEPHRFEKARIRRLESQIQYDATILVAKNPKQLYKANERLWVWMCTFREPDTGRPTYSRSVKRIISVLSLKTVQCLCSIKVDDNTILIDAANSACLRVIQKRLDQLVKSTPSPINENIESVAWEPEAEFVGHLCRLVFNVPEMAFPTSFIILPYELRKEANGALRLASPEASVVATLFAECLMNLTEPTTILATLDAKSVEHFGRSIFNFEPDDAFYLETITNVREYEQSLVSLFESGEGYLYLIDESTGLPRIGDSDDIYPIVLRKPSGLVEELLPLMLMGMIQMRGEKAIPKLISVVLGENIATVPPSWIEASERLLAYLGTQDPFELEAHIDVAETQNLLRAFRHVEASKHQTASRPKNGRSEWNSELLVLKMLFEENDFRGQFSGLSVASRKPVPLLFDAANASERAQEYTLQAQKYGEGSSATPKLEPVSVVVDVEFDDDASTPDASEVSRKLDSDLSATVSEFSRRFKNAVSAQNRESDNDSAYVPVQYQHPVCETTALSSYYYELGDDLSPHMSILSQKMDELSQLRDSVAKEAWRTSPTAFDRLSPEPFDQEGHIVIVQESSSDESGVKSRSDKSEFSRQRKQLLSKYDVLFEQFDNDDAYHDDESTMEMKGNVLVWNDVDGVWEDIVVTDKVWNDVDRVWEDVEWQLHKRAENVYEDPQILQLKVALAEQAKKLADLGKKVTSLKNDERRIITPEGEIYDLTRIDDSDISARETARKLVIRMCDLEERLVCDAIQIQHLSMEAIRAEDEGAEMVIGTPSNDRTKELPPRCEMPRELSGISWKTHGDPSNFSSSDSDVSYIRYERLPITSKPKVVRFEGIPEKYASPKVYDTSSSIRNMSGRVPVTDLSTATHHSYDDKPSAFFLSKHTLDSAKSDPDGLVANEVSTESSYNWTVGKRRDATMRSSSNDIPSDQALSGNTEEVRVGSPSPGNLPAFVEAMLPLDCRRREEESPDPISTRDGINRDIEPGSLSPLKALQQSRVHALLTEDGSTTTDTSVNQRENSPPKLVQVTAPQKDPPLSSEEHLPEIFTFDPNKESQTIARDNLYRNEGDRRGASIYQDEIESYGSFVRSPTAQCRSETMTDSLEGNEGFDSTSRILVSSRQSESVAESTLSTSVTSVFRPAKTITINNNMPTRSRTVSGLSGEHSEGLIDLSAVNEETAIDQLIARYTEEGILHSEI